MPNDSRFPRLLTCNQCGETAIVKAYLPVYGDQQNQAAKARAPTAMTCVIDCPTCGVRNQNVT
jgi:hypothetical protein